MPYLPILKNPSEQFLDLHLEPDHFHNYTSCCLSMDTSLVKLLTDSQFINEKSVGGDAKYRHSQFTDEKSVSRDAQLAFGRIVQQGSVPGKCLRKFSMKGNVQDKCLEVYVRERCL